MQTVEVGIREFRADLANYIESNTAIAVTRHGQTVGVFIPTPSQKSAHLAALKHAGLALESMVTLLEPELDEVVKEFQLSRAASQKPNKTVAKVAAVSKATQKKATARVAAKKV